MSISIPRHNSSEKAFFQTQPSSLSVVWKQASWIHAAEIYRQLVLLLSNDLGFIKAFASFVDPTDYDSFARVMVRVFYHTGRILPLIRTMIDAELASVTSTCTGSAMRGNSISSKLEGAYVRIIGTDYLKKVLGNLLTSIVLDKELELEIDPSKMKSQKNQSGEISTPNQVISEHLRMLESLVMAFVSRITDPEMIEEMPREMRAIAGYVAEGAKRCGIGDQWEILVGGFIMLRVFSPAIISPEVLHLIPSDVAPSATSRRNLVLITKLLQAISNGGTIGAKEQFMLPLSDFVKRISVRMKEYLVVISSDSNWTPDSGLQPWGDLDVEPSDVDISQFDLNNLFELHRLILNCRDKILVKFGEAPVSPRTTPSNQSVSSCSSPPNSTPLSSSPLSSCTWVPVHTRWRRQLLCLLRVFDPAPSSRCSKKLTENDRTSSPFGTDALADTSVLERARFLYQGPNTAKGMPVFYIIVNRFRAEFLDNINPLIAFMYKIMDAGVNTGQYILILDTSWANISSDLKKQIYRQMQSIWNLFSRPYKKNLEHVYIVHPSSFSHAVTFFLRAFVSRKMWHKVTEVYNWKQLTNILSPENILLPDTSKDFITKTYPVTKINAKGKHQERIIKFTLDSLLNIDPKTKTIRNEKKLVDIEEIWCNPGSPELHMRFKTPSEQTTVDTSTRSRERGVSFTVSKLKLRERVFSADSQDLLYRTYVCNSIQERDDIVRDIFTSGFLANNIDHQYAPQEYKVIKVNSAGKHQERTFKLTRDSLLNLEGNHIKTEIAFAGISDVTIDPTKPDVMWLKYKVETQWRKIISKNASLLVSAVLDSIRQYTTEESDAGNKELEEGSNSSRATAD